MTTTSCLLLASPAGNPSSRASKATDKRCSAVLCFSSGNANPATKVCSRCKQKRYCCKSCQVLDWSNHKLDCTATANAPSWVLTPVHIDTAVLPNAENLNGHKTDEFTLCTPHGNKHTPVCKKRDDKVWCFYCSISVAWKPRELRNRSGLANAYCPRCAVDLRAELDKQVSFRDPLCSTSDWHLYSEIDPSVVLLAIQNNMPVRCPPMWQKPMITRDNADISLIPQEGACSVCAQHRINLVDGACADCRYGESLKGSDVYMHTFPFARRVTCLMCGEPRFSTHPTRTENQCRSCFDCTSNIAATFVGPCQTGCQFGCSECIVDPSEGENRCVRRLQKEWDAADAAMLEKPYCVR